MFSALSFLSALSAGNSAKAEERLHAELPEISDDMQRMTYDVYAGGFHVVNAVLDIDFPEKERYRLALSAHTRGFLGSLAPWHGIFETHGWYNEKTKEAKPELHKSTTTWRDEEEIKEYSYCKDGSFEVYRITDDKNDGSPQDVPDELTQGTIDALTATLSVMQKVADDQKCEGSSEVFDGKRRFELVFSYQGSDDLKSSNYNVYEGPAEQCVVEVKPIAGKWYKKPRGWLSIQEQGRDRGALPTVWLAKMEENAPSVPVKIQIKSQFGTLFMHLTEYQNAKISKTAEKKKKK